MPFRSRGSANHSGLYNKDLNVPAYDAALAILSKSPSAAFAFLMLNAKERATFNHYNKFQESLGQPMGRSFRAVGDNIGPYISWSYVAYLKDDAKNFDDTNAPEAPSATAQNFVKEELVPVQAMPWWTMKYKSHHYWYADGTDDINQASHDFTINFSVAHGAGTRNTPFAERVEQIRDALAFAYSTVSPRYPQPIDANIAEVGRKIFHGEQPTESGATATCAMCHGTYKRSGDDLAQWQVKYPAGRIVHDVGTDLSYWTLLQKFVPLQQRLDAIGKRSGSTLVPSLGVNTSLGYTPPPLDGVWASAPYFHNGSVPTLWAVLKPEDRPTIWQSSGSARDYDLDKVGLKVTSVSAEDYTQIVAGAKTKTAELSAPALTYRRTYSTLEATKSNQGHLFGEILNDNERLAIIEFLKSVSGPGVRPGQQP